ncbi:hypothetical protein MEX01_46160 [Methylorubrum extorquens]|nr:hypothetical protein MEX01_46160 [Methylorubrum extorquens]
MQRHILERPARNEGVDAGNALTPGPEMAGQGAGGRPVLRAGRRARDRPVGDVEGTGEGGFLIRTRRTPADPEMLVLCGPPQRLAAGSGEGDEGAPRAAPTRKGNARPIASPTRSPTIVPRCGRAPERSRTCIPHPDGRTADAINAQERPPERGPAGGPGGTR